MKLSQKIASKYLSFILLTRLFHFVSINTWVGAIEYIIKFFDLRPRSSVRFLYISL